TIRSTCRTSAGGGAAGGGGADGRGGAAAGPGAGGPGRRGRGGGGGGGGGRCEYCQAGDAQVCPRQTQPGFTGPGSFAELVAVHAADTNLVALPEAVDFVAAACLGCRFATAFRPVTAAPRAAGPGRAAARRADAAPHGPGGGAGTGALRLARHGRAGLPGDDG